MMSMVEEFPANDKCLALRSRLFPDAWERPTSCEWWDSTKPNKAGSRMHAGAFRARRASSKHQFLAPRGFVFFFGQFAICFQNYSKRIFQVLASLFQSLALGVNPRNFFYPGSPPITHLVVRSGQFHVCIFLAFGLLVQSLPAREIVQKPLDEFVIYNLPIAFKSGNTTVLFPSAISALYAKSIAVQEQPNADFLISFTPGNYYFTVRALKREAEDHLTVIYNRKAYVLHLSASDKPFYTVTFFQDATSRGPARPVVPERLLSLMDKAKAYPLFEKDYPDALAGVLHAAPNATNYYDKFKLLIRDVWRFEQEDTLVFRIELENSSDSTIYYKPQDLAVRLEDRIYTQSIADASGVMPPKSTTPAFFAVTGNGQGGRNNLAPDNKWNVLVVRDRRSTATGGVQMNLRQVWTEIFQKPAGRLILFLLIGGIFLAFILLRRGPQPKPDNTQVAHQATQAKSYSFDEDIPAPARAQSTPAERTYDKAARITPAPKPPPPIPQTIFVTKEQSVSELFLPYGRLLRCELVNTVDSTNIDTPIIGLVIEDAWNDGRLIIPAGTEVHGVAQKSAVRERIGSDRQWFLVFQDGRELPVSGTVLDYAPDPKKPNAWNESDGSAGLRGFFVKSDKYAEAKAILASMISAGAGAFPQTTTLLSPLGGATQINSGGIESAFSAGLQAGGQIYSKRLLEQLEKNPFYVRVPAGAMFYLYITQTVDLGKATVGLSASLAPSSSPKQP